MEQLHTAEADAGQAEASLNALLEDEASKHASWTLRKWLGDKSEEKPVEDDEVSTAGAESVARAR